MLDIVGLANVDNGRELVDVLSGYRRAGILGGQLDAWILAECVTTSAGVRTLASLCVPLAQGPFSGQAHAAWPTPRA